MNCRNCGVVTKENDKFCSNCGEPLIDKNHNASTIVNDCIRYQIKPF